MQNLRIMAIDPGTKESAYVVISTNPKIKVLEHATVDNYSVFSVIEDFTLSMGGSENTSELLIEDIESYGMAVGWDVFQTVRWTGRFDREWWHLTQRGARYIKRSKIKTVLCGSTRAKDPNIRQALIDMWGPTGTMKAPGLIYGISKHLWSALAVATVYLMELDPKVDEELKKLQVGIC